MASVKTRAARQGNWCLVEGFSALLSYRDLISGFHEVRLLVPNAMRDEAGMRSRLLSGRALMPKEIPGRDLPDQVEIISLHGLQTPTFPGSSWNSLDVVFRLPDRDISKDPALVCSRRVRQTDQPQHMPQCRRGALTGTTVK